MINPVIKSIGMGRAVIQWAGITPEFPANPFMLTNYTPQSVQVSGLFANGVISLLGSNDPDIGKDFYTLKSERDLLVFNASGLEHVVSNCVHIVPQLSGGTEHTELTVNLLVTAR